MQESTKFVALINFKDLTIDKENYTADQWGLKKTLKTTQPIMTGRVGTQWHL